MIMENLEQLKYDQALKRVKRIKGFYTHLIVYIVINIAVFISNYQQLEPNEPFFGIKLFSTPLFWGIGLLAHGLSVFMPTWFLGKDWEERKIKELMEKQKNNKWE
ncbi:MAG: 2TM domain-containing protein [Flavobacterium sp.]|jgi:hypothetical protein|uniref:2TM domain-containing protein n=2 Tax=Flavobacterium sp. TaxID=239 RepID=UPI002FDA0273